ncbi:MAG: hypothetical protein J7501_15045, partial [Bdellovibrio sp.]|nr:hypothetical protein [Bdellovibrio sp.]
IKPVALAVEKKSMTLFAKKVVLAEMVVTKNVEPVQLAQQSFSSDVSADSAWIHELPRAQRARLEAAQMRTEVIDQDWSQPSWGEVATQALQKSGAVNAEGEIVGNENSKVYVAAASSSAPNKLSRPQVYSASSASRTPSGNDDKGPGLSERGYLPASTASLVDDTSSKIRRIVGPIEITGGLAVTNEHHIEIRRNDEGVLKELGRVDLLKGTYNIDVEEAIGTVVARLVNKDGKTLGEGSFRLNKLVAGDLNFLQGPKIKVEPHPDFSGILTSAYNSKANDTAPAQTRVTFVKGASEVAVKRDGVASMDNVTKGSTTVMRAAAPKHLQTASIVVSGQEFKSSLYPESMIKALQDIVGQQRSQSFDGAPTVIWGRISQDGKSLSGIDVSVESDPSLIPIYFNQFLIPDASLKSTSENGLYAFIEVQPGFHSLLATRGSSILGYSNVIVEENSVGQGDIEFTIKNDSVPLRVFDAFTGESRPAIVTMQSLENDLNLETGNTTLTLPHLNRLGLMRVIPEGADYIPARYIYNDSDEFIHVPLVQWEWLRAIKSFLKISDAPSTGLVVGFVQDEDFEVYLAGYDNFNPQDIVYFDMQGRILQNRKGIAGGGFVLYNVPYDTQEVVVMGSRTQKIYSRVIPVDANSLSILNFRE